MARRSWFGYQPAAVEEAKQAAYAAFEAELAHLHAAEGALRERVLQLRDEEERLTLALSQMERSEEAARTALIRAIDSESAQLQALKESYAQEEAEQRARIGDMTQERERVARIEASLIAAIKGAIAAHPLQEGERP